MLGEHGQNISGVAHHLTMPTLTEADLTAAATTTPVKVKQESAAASSTSSSLPSSLVPSSVSKPASAPRGRKSATKTTKSAGGSVRPSTKGKNGAASSSAVKREPGAGGDRSQPSVHRCPPSLLPLVAPGRDARSWDPSKLAPFMFPHHFHHHPGHNGAHHPFLFHFPLVRPPDPPHSAAKLQLPQPLPPGDHQDGRVPFPLPMPHLLTPEHPLHNVPIPLLLPHIFGPRLPPAHGSTVSDAAISTALANGAAALMPRTSPASIASSTSAMSMSSPLAPAFSHALGVGTTPQHVPLSPMLGSPFSFHLPSAFIPASAAAAHHMTSPALSSSSSPPSASLPHSTQFGSPSLLPSLMASPSQPGLSAPLSSHLPSLADSPPYTTRPAVNGRMSTSSLNRLSAHAEGEEDDAGVHSDMEPGASSATRSASADAAAVGPTMRTRSMGKSIFQAGQ